MPLRFNHMELTLPKGALTHDREEIVGAPGRRQDRAIFIALKAVEATDADAAGPGR